MEIMSLRPDMPEIAVDENISSVSISENKIINLDVTITDTDENGEGGTSTTLGYSVFLLTSIERHSLNLSSHS